MPISLAISPSSGPVNTVFTATVTILPEATLTGVLVELKFRPAGLTGWTVYTSQTVDLILGVPKEVAFTVTSTIEGTFEVVATGSKSPYPPEDSNIVTILVGEVPPPPQIPVALILGSVLLGLGAGAYFLLRR